MKVSAVSVMKKLAARNFKLGKAEFLGFEKIDIEEVASEATPEDLEDYGAHLEIWANLKISYEGEPPESYRVLNGMLQDWVDEADGRSGKDGSDLDFVLKKQVNPKLIDFLKDQYKDIDTSDLQEDVDDYVWEDQVDYMPEIDEDKKEINFIIELVLDVDDSEEDE